MTTTSLSRPSATRFYSTTRSAVLLASAALAALAVIAFGLSLALGLQPLVVTSGAMEPAIPVGCVVISRAVPATEVQVGGIVTLQRVHGAGPVTSRVVEATARGAGAVELTLRGDAEEPGDREHYVTSRAGLYVMQVPWLGHVVMLLQGPAGLPTGVGPGRRAGRGRRGRPRAITSVRPEG